MKSSLSGMPEQIINIDSYNILKEKCKMKTREQILEEQLDIALYALWNIAAENLDLNRYKTSHWKDIVMLDTNIAREALNNIREIGEEK